MTSLHRLAVSLLWVAFASSMVLGATTWRDKVASSVLRWIDSGSLEERDLVVRVGVNPGSTTPTGSYAAASHRAWLLEEQLKAADIVIWSQLEPSFAMQRRGSTTWEVGLPYVHELRAVFARASAAGATQLAQLGAVVAVLDGAPAVPEIAAFEGNRGVSEVADPPTPHQLLNSVSVSSAEMEAWMTALGWRYVAREDITMPLNLETPIAVSSTALALGTAAYDLVGLAVSDGTRVRVEAGGASLSGAFGSASWAPPSLYAPTVAEVARLVEAMRQTGADGVCIASVVLGGEEDWLYILLRSSGGEGWASSATPQPGTSTTQDALPRAEAPTEISATRGSYADRVVLQWQPAPGASTYEILRTSASSGAYEPVGISEKTTFDDAGVESCVQYSYVARSIEHGGIGIESPRAVGFVGRVPMPPERIWADGGATAGAIRVEWTPSDGATRYEIMRTQYMTGSSKVTAQQYCIGLTSETSFVDADIVVGQTYLYRVFASNGCGQSELSPQAKGSALYSLPPRAGALVPPSWFETTRGEPRYEVVLSWTAAQGADSYVVLRALAYAGEYVEVGRVAGTVWHDVDVVLCGDYWYRVQSVRGGAVSDPSPILYGSCGYRPVAPERVRASRGTYSQSIRVDWAPVEDAVTYQVSRAPNRDGPFAVIAPAVAELYFIDEGLSPGQTFWYKVRAVNDCGCSGDLGAVSGSTSSEG